MYLQKLLSSLVIGFMVLSMGASSKEESLVSPVVSNVNATLFTKNVVDHHSLANINDARVTHISLNMNVDMEKGSISSVAEYDFVRRSPTVDTIVFDIAPSLDIRRSIQLIDAQGTKTNAAFSKENTEKVGQSLTVWLLPSTQKIRIAYEVAPTAGAVAFVPKEQTNGKTAPFLYTQGESTHSRTWFPCQDSPSVRTTYSANVRVPNNFLALMNGVNPTEKTASGEYNFQMKNPIPAYLISLVVGDLVYHSSGPRSGVYTEQVDLDLVKAQFTDTEQMIDVAEMLFGPYRWDRYDLVIMPPNFPYGGMENPSLVYFTRMAVTGTKENNYIVAHELAHFWFGNLVTNATWEDFWLNEGPTTYAETRLVEAIYPDGVTGLFHKASQDGSLRNELKHLSDTPAKTRLRLDLKGKEADEGVTLIAYYKGSLMMRTLELELSRPVLDEILRKYLETFTFQSVDAETFIRFITEEVQRATGRPIRTDLRKWIFEEGVPDESAVIDSAVTNKVANAVKNFLKGELKLEDLDVAEWGPLQLQLFMSSLPVVGITSEQIKQLDGKFGFSSSKNETIQMRWFGKVLAEHFALLSAETETFLMESKTAAIMVPERFVKPLVTTPEGLKLARKFFDQRQSEMHNTVRPAIKQMIEDAEKAATK